MSASDTVKIVITRDGPYEVFGNVPLRNAIIGTNEQGESLEWLDGKEYDTGGEMYQLCRCGHSRTKPLCDGSHNDAEFCGREKADRPPYRETASMQKGETIDLLDDDSLCAGARFCDVEKTVWNMAYHSSDPDNREKAIQEACKCPSGRLTILEDGEPVEPVLPMGIGVIQDPEADARGPLWVKGGIPIEGAGGEKYEVRNRVTLCRCGESGNQPYCNGAHRRVEHMRGMDE
jgi:CDGSH-type Zn-finger protein